MTDGIQQFNFDVDLLKSILWQYENAPNIKALIEAKQEVWDENFTDFWDNFITDIFDLRTANDFGLSVWAIILGAPIVYNLPGAGTAGWGFGQFRKNFNNGNFASNSGVVYPLSTESARIILRLRYYQLTGTCTVPAINRMLVDIFADYGLAYVLDGLQMNQKYLFKFVLPTDLQFAFNNYDILPRPAGVKGGWSTFAGDVWGFNPDAQNFEHGNFGA